MIDLLTDLALMGLRPVARPGNPSREQEFEGLLEASSEELGRPVPGALEAAPDALLHSPAARGPSEDGMPHIQTLPPPGESGQTGRAADEPAVVSGIPRTFAQERPSDVADHRQADRPLVADTPAVATPSVATPSGAVPQGVGRQVIIRPAGPTTEGGGHQQIASSTALPSDPTVRGTIDVARPVGAETVAEEAIVRLGMSAPTRSADAESIRSTHDIAVPIEPSRAEARSPAALVGTAAERAFGDAVVRVVSPAPRSPVPAPHPAAVSVPVPDAIAFDPARMGRMDVPVPRLELEPPRPIPSRGTPSGPRVSTAREALIQVDDPSAPRSTQQTEAPRTSPSLRPTLAEARQLLRAPSPAPQSEPSAVRLESTGPLATADSPVARPPLSNPAGPPELRVVTRPAEWVPDRGRLQGADVNGPTLQSELFRLPTPSEPKPRALALVEEPVETTVAARPRPVSRPGSPTRSRAKVASRVDASPELRLVDEPARAPSASESSEGAATAETPARPQPRGPQMAVRRVRVELDPSMAVEVSVRADGVDVAVDGTRDALDQLDALEPELRAALDEGVEALEQGRGSDLGDAWGESDRRERSQLLSYEQIEREDPSGFEEHAELAGGFEDADDGSGDRTANDADAEPRDERSEISGRLARSYGAARDWRGTRIDRIA